MQSYRIIAYDINALSQCLVESSGASVEVVRRKLHFQYFSDYFSHLSAKTILIESNYVDHDYLEDYAAYYVRCFQQYSRSTTRLHFFSLEFSEQEFKKLLKDSGSCLNGPLLQNQYLGFVVVKPLPQTIIGRTCLRTYSDDPGRRMFPNLRQYLVNLFGIELMIDSLAYQEQDTVVAACATSALWSCFQGTGKLFQHAIPSPVEITRAATRYVPENLPANSARAFPNSGLTATQMALAVRDVGLEPFLVGTPTSYVLNSTLYAYLRCRIPSILTIHLVDVSGDENRYIGAHAVAVTGFSLGSGQPVPSDDLGGFLLRASRIDKMYAHDDQVGPFSRMGHASDTNGSYLVTSWSNTGLIKAIPIFVLLPVYHKIRIPFDIVHDAIQSVDAVIETVRQQVGLPRPEWDIYLTTVGEFKKDIFDSMRGLLGSAADDALTANLPRFIWRVTARCEGEYHLDLLFDATGIAQQQLLVHVIEGNPGGLASLISGMAPLVQGSVGNAQAESIFQWFMP
ncbi:hypothetical protein [Acidithiobacillus thiooxidans]|nr:hypothetical protein [Acidithiobacillus thiooxidans]